MRKVPRFTPKDPSPIPGHAVIGHEPPIRRSQEADGAVRRRCDDGLDPIGERPRGFPMNMPSALWNAATHPDGSAAVSSLYR